MTQPHDTLGRVQDSWLLGFLLLMLAAVVVIVVQSLRLTRQSEIAAAHAEIARANHDAARREEARYVAGRARSLRAVGGELGALALLERAGYRVVDRQVPGSWSVLADGESVTFGLRADYLVSRRGRRYIAEVKTGRLAPRLSHGPTRRQLLEYRAAFDVHGVILVDADAETITHVEVDPFARRATGGEVDVLASLAARGGMPRAEVRGITLRVVAIVAVVSFAIGVVAHASIAK